MRKQIVFETYKMDWNEIDQGVELVIPWTWSFCVAGCSWQWADNELTVQGTIRNSAKDRHHGFGRRQQGRHIDCRRSSVLHCSTAPLLHCSTAPCKSCAWSIRSHIMSSCYLRNLRVELCVTNSFNFCYILPFVGTWWNQPIQNCKHTANILLHSLCLLLV